MLYAVDDRRSRFPGIYQVINRYSRYSLPSSPKLVKIMDGDYYLLARSSAVLLGTYETTAEMREGSIHCDTVQLDEGTKVPIVRKKISNPGTKSAHNKEHTYAP